MLIGSLMSSAQAASLVYVGNAESNDISVLRLDRRSGALTAIETIAIPGVTEPGPTSPMAISPDKSLLFIGIRSQPYIAASFAIDAASGKLTHRGNGPLADAMAYIVTDRSGRYLLSASYGGHKVTVNPIGRDGVVGAAQQVVETAPNAHCILPDAANRFALATSLGGDLVNQLRFDAASGRLTPNTPASVTVKDKAGPRHLAFHPTGRFAYVIGELDGAIYAFDYDATQGRLSEIQAVSALPPGFAGKPWAADLHVTPDGRFLYGSERTSSTLAGFRIDPASGKLSPIGSYATEQQPRGFRIDPTGRYLLAVGQLSHRMTSYAIDQATGALSKLKDYPVGRNPNWVEIVDLP
jgi:6-phosphogluconolactonase